MLRENKLRWHEKGSLELSTIKNIYLKSWSLLTYLYFASASWSNNDVLNHDRNHKKIWNIQENLETVGCAIELDRRTDMLQHACQREKCSYRKGNPCRCHSMVNPKWNTTEQDSAYDWKVILHDVVSYIPF